MLWHIFRNRKTGCRCNLQPCIKSGVWLINELFLLRWGARLDLTELFWETTSCEWMLLFRLTDCHDSLANPLKKLGQERIFSFQISGYFGTFLFPGSKLARTSVSTNVMFCSLYCITLYSYRDLARDLSNVLICQAPLMTAVSIR